MAGLQFHQWKTDSDLSLKRYQMSNMHKVLISNCRRETANAPADMCFLPCLLFQNCFSNRVRPRGDVNHIVKRHPKSIFLTAVERLVLTWQFKTSRTQTMKETLQSPLTLTGTYNIAQRRPSRMSSSGFSPLSRERERWLGGPVAQPCFKKWDLGAEDQKLPLGKKERVYSKSGQSRMMKNSTLKMRQSFLMGHKNSTFICKYILGYGVSRFPPLLLSFLIISNRLSER